MTNTDEAEIERLRTERMGLIDANDKFAAEIERLRAISASHARENIAMLSEIERLRAAIPDVNALDAVVHKLGIEDDHITPAEAVEELMAEIERLRFSTGREIVALWMRANGIATGHGDTIEDLLMEIGGEVERLRLALDRANDPTWDKT